MTQNDATDWVVLGKIGAPFGLAGWVQVHSYTDNPTDILDYPQWWLQKGGYEVPLAREDHDIKGDKLLVKCLGCEDKQMAATYTGAAIVVRRDMLPRLDDGEYYWVDLEGCTVQQADTCQVLGTVSYLYAGAQDTMVVIDTDGANHHIPFIQRDVVKTVSLDKRLITVDWVLS